MGTQRERILAQSDVLTELVPVPKWGETVRVRSLTAEEVERWWTIVDQHKEQGIDPPGGRRASLVFMGTINEDGSDLFKIEDIPSLGKKHSDAIQPVFEAILRLSGLTKEAAADIEKKPDAPTNSSSTSSPTGSAGQTSTNSSES